MRISGKLQQEKVWDIVTTELSPGAPDTQTAHSKSWSIHNSKAASIIIAYVSDSLLLQIDDLQHAKKMYDKLMEIYKNINVDVTTFYTYIHMNQLKWDGSSSLNTHISTILAANTKTYCNEEAS